MPSSYPTSLDTTTSLSTAVNGLQTTLNGDHTSGATTVTVASTSGAASAGYVWLDSEVVKYAGLTPTTLTGCTRGADGTAAASHNNGAVVKFGLVADHHNALVSAIVGAQTKLGTNTNGASASTIDANQLAAGTIHSAAVADSDILFRKMKLENNVTRIHYIQGSIGTIAVTAGTWANAGSSTTITPAVNSLIMCWGTINGAMGVSTTDYLRILFNGGNGTNAGLGNAARDDALGQRAVYTFDTFSATAGAVTLQLQMQTDNNGTWTFSAAKVVQLTIFAIAIPST